MSNLYKIVLSATGYKPSKGSEIERDSEGFYKVRLGAFNVFNSGKAFYSGEGIKELLTDPNSFFYRRLKKGYLLGEMGHPVMEPGMSMGQFMNRNAVIDPQNVACFIKDIEIVDTGEKVNNMGNYGNVLIVNGWIKPSGPKGKYLQEALDTPDRNIAFSVRSLSKDTLVNGVVIKQTKAVLTWDWVFEPGINNANTFDMLNNKVVNTESCNTLISLDVTEEDLKDMINIENTTINTESNKETITNLSNIISKELVTNSTVSKIYSW